MSKMSTETLFLREIFLTYIKFRDNYGKYNEDFNGNAWDFLRCQDFQDIKVWLKSNRYKEKTFLSEIQNLEQNRVLLYSTQYNPVWEGSGKDCNLLLRPRALYKQVYVL